MGDSFASVMTIAMVRLGIQRPHVTVVGQLIGYHETITYAHLRFNDDCRKRDPPAEIFETFCQGHAPLNFRGVMRHRP
jgi:hypothetical protein